MVKIIRKIESKLNQLDRSLCRQRVIFLHIPKCGGTSIGTAIASSINASTKGFIDPIRTKEITKEISNNSSENFQLLLQLRQAMLLQSYMRDEPYIFGHFPIVRKVLEEPKDYLVVTVLREPVARFISQFKYYLATRYLVKQDKLLDHDEIELIWNNYLKSNLACFHSNTFSAYLNDQAHLGFGNQQATDRAIENLKDFHVLGFIDNLEQFKKGMKEFVPNEITIPSKNQTNNKISKLQSEILDSFFDEHKYNIAKQLCFHDVQVYQFAKTLNQKKCIK